MEKSSSRVEGAERGRDADTSLLHELDAKNLSERIILRGVETHEVLGVVLLLREVRARSLFETYQHDASLLNRVLDNYEPAANRIAVTVGVDLSMMQAVGDLQGGIEEAERQLSYAVTRTGRIARESEE